MLKTAKEKKAMSALAAGIRQSTGTPALKKVEKVFRGPIYEVMSKFDKGSRWDITPLNLPRQYKIMRMIDQGASLIHFVMWKFRLIALTWPCVCVKERDREKEENLLHGTKNN